mgnify:FL=1
MQRVTDDTNGNNNLIALEAKNPEWDTETGQGKKTNIGEAILAVPADTYDLTIELSQKVKIYDDGSTTQEDTKKFSYNDVIKLTNDVFKAGYSYNVNITVFGLSEIKINTTLTPWEEGGNIDMNPEDNGTPGATPTPGETYDYTIVTEGTEGAESTVYANLDELKAAVKAGTATEGKIYKVGEGEPYTFYKVTKKSSTVTPAPTTYKFADYTYQGTEEVAGNYDTKELLDAADLLKEENKDKIYKVGTEDPYTYYQIVVNE